jgi:CheY-like chemotaxis protein
MPKMDGLQVLAIVRRKFPQLRTIVLTAVSDEQFRNRAYAMGIDLYLEKPSNQKEITFFLDCVESLLTKDKVSGFRGIQSKSLVDLIQLECLSQSSSVLRITNGKVEGKIWISNGDVIDAATQEFEGEEAFKRILSWKTGNFEILPAENDHPRKIQTSYQGLLLDSAQSMDEAQAQPASIDSPEAGATTEPPSKLSTIARLPGVQFVLVMNLQDEKSELRHWGLENPDQLARWIRETHSAFQKVGDNFQFGGLQSVHAASPHLRLHIQPVDGNFLVLGLKGTLEREEITNIIKRALERWAS